MVIDDINNLKMSVHSLLSMVEMIQFFYYEVDNSETFDKMLVTQCVNINEQLELIQELNNKIKRGE